MNKYLLTLIPLLLVGIIVSYLYTHHRLQEVHRLLHGSTVAVQSLTIASCGCTADTDEHFPTTPQQIKQAQINNKREEAQGELLDKQTDNRVRRLIRVGMSRKQVEQIMGPCSWMGSPEVTVKGHPSDDADFYSDYQIAFTAKDVVTSVSYDSH